MVTLPFMFSYILINSFCCYKWTYLLKIMTIYYGDSSSRMLPKSDTGQVWNLKKLLWEMYLLPLPQQCCISLHTAAISKKMLCHGKVEHTLTFWSNRNPAVVAFNSQWTCIQVWSISNLMICIREITQLSEYAVHVATI